MVRRDLFALFCSEFLPFSQTFIYDELRSHERYSGEVFSLRRSHTDRFPFGAVHTPGSLAAKLLYFSTTRSPSFQRRFAARDFRLVHAHFGTGAIHALPYARMFGLPLIVTFHGYDVGLLQSLAKWSPWRWRYWALSRRILSQAALLLCASDELRSIISDLSGRPEATRTHRLGVDLARFHRQSRQRSGLNVTMIGRFVEKKGFDDGLRAFAKATMGDTDIRLTIAGDGPLRESYEALAASLRIGPRVSFVGPLTPAGVAELLSVTDVLLCPSRTGRGQDRESGLMVAKEASASEVPVLGTRHGGIPEIVDDARTGFLVPERDVAGLADRLALLLGQPELRRTFGLAGRRKMEREYGLGARNEALEAFYDEARSMGPPLHRANGSISHLARAHRSRRS